MNCNSFEIFERNRGLTELVSVNHPFDFYMLPFPYFVTSEA